ncbi:MAG: HlyD family efflux transporter periplasmic adaptor subunit [Planctomycetaceae bacterium]|nr:HlyD family efflux transporter periplasmic adaptor subunit [Planctomycetaceae bacterium]
MDRISRLMSFCFVTAIVAAACQSTQAEDITVHGVRISPVTDTNISSIQSGLVREVHVTVGQTVAPGDLLLTLNDDDARLRLEQALADYEIAKHAAQNELPIQLAERTLAVAEAEYQRAVEVNEKHPGTVSASEVSKLRLASERAELELQQARKTLEAKRLSMTANELEVKAAQLHVSQHRVVAPCRGIVTDISHQIGEWIATGQPCCRLVDLSVLKAEGFVVATSPLELVGKQATLIPQGISTELKIRGRVTFVDPEINPVNGQCRIRVALEDAPKQVHPGLTGSMLVHDSESSE